MGNKENEAENINENVDAEAKDESVNAEETAEVNAEAENAEAENNGESTETEINAEAEENAESSDNNSESSETADSENAPEESGDVKDGESKALVFKKIGAFVKSKKFLIPLCSVFGAAVLIYFGGVIFYSSHFFAGTHIGAFDCSNMTAAAAKENMQKELDNYDFTFFEKDGKKETINGEEIGFTNTPIVELDSLKAKQNPFTWFFADKKAKKFPLDIEISYNEDALYNRITQMDFMAVAREGAQGKAQSIRFADGVYTIEDDSSGDIVSQNDIFNRVKPKIKELYRGMSLEKENCYGGLENDDTIKGVLNLLNKYTASKITYTGSTTSRVLDGTTFNDWITVGDDYSININPDKITEYVDDVSIEYNTVGKERTFKTTGGSEITVSGGNYGWIVNKKKEADEIRSNITSGEAVEREPIYSQKAASHGASDVANTYVEVSIGGQHMWYYKNGELLVSSDVVTGNPYNGHGTPGGVYKVAYKARNVVLKGQGYASPVSYWMPFNGGIGLHDATWRGAFGGGIYRGGGSHGCVNLPYSVAQKLFGVISEGDPVVVY